VKATSVSVRLRTFLRSYLYQQAFWHRCIFSSDASKCQQAFWCRCRGYKCDARECQQAFWRRCRGYKPGATLESVNNALYKIRMTKNFSHLEIYPKSRIQLSLKISSHFDFLCSIHTTCYTSCYSLVDFYSHLLYLTN
jgi:hypothetical protein